MATIVQGTMTLLARLMLTAVFLWLTIAYKIPDFKATVARMAMEGVPQPRLALFCAIGVLLLGSLSVIAGAWARAGAVFLFAFLAAATFYYHDFWMIQDANTRFSETWHFMKNVAIGGGLLMLAAFGPGPWSVDGWIEQKMSEAEGAAGQRPAKADGKP